MTLSYKWYVFVWKKNLKLIKATSIAAEIYLSATQANCELMWKNLYGQVGVDDFTYSLTLLYQ